MLASGRLTAALVRAQESEGLSVADAADIYGMAGRANGAIGEAIAVTGKAHRRVFAIGRRTGVIRADEWGPETPRPEYMLAREDMTDSAAA